MQAKNTVVEGDELTITNTTATGAKRDYEDMIKFTVSNSDYEDVAYALFKDGHGLNKIEHRNEAIQKLYIQHNGEDFASANIGEDVRAFNLNFHATTMGKYILNISVDGNFSYLHLIDKISGEDVDLLLDDEYSFVGTTSDRDNRFIVKFKYQSSASVDADVFAFLSGNDIVVEGDGELQIFDVTGRLVSTHYINGVETIRKPSRNGMCILRLIGETTKVQKIVVK